ncbi:arginine n-methyltransferase-like protein [Thalassiosira pseudonana CCMP1335]|uniref:Arginine n-methyltransferase-like protein n=1 Tax=Thalassiosira pseudonana TaxID=35128 RepID=B8C9A4_THAPS|nr:arginine n-methyltransferase-like protein [Thalassiosira pseudonana CCMP1335]EED89822.1 arginine n-methyltransferase-like protein [Thalassiosira pseudonana CCMP1335]
MPTSRSANILASCLFALAQITCTAGFLQTSRRAALEKLQQITVTPFVATSLIQPSIASASESTPISASWTAVDGLNSLEKKFVSFDKSAYQAMVNDQSRTPLFEQAIISRLKSSEGGPESQVVLDLGTGPFALFAVAAAKAGAGKVYAIEASKEAAASARETVKKLGFDDKITILEGFSTDITLPDGIKADFAVAEIVGSVASEEGAYATILDASKRLVKNPGDAASWIPSRIQTYAAPASYTLHNLFLPPAFDWSKLDGEPVRFNCRDEGLQLLSDPVLVEDISFADIASEKGALKKQVTFIVDGGRIEQNAKQFREEFKKGGLPKEQFEQLSVTTANSVSGIALWPRLILDGTVDINSRHYPDGGHQKSHWQTVLSIMSAIPLKVKSGDQVTVTFDFDVPSDVTRPSYYNISGNVVNI